MFRTRECARARVPCVCVFSLSRPPSTPPPAVSGVYRCVLRARVRGFRIVVGHDDPRGRHVHSSRRRRRRSFRPTRTTLLRYRNLKHHTRPSKLFFSILLVDFLPSPPQYNTIIVLGTPRRSTLDLRVVVVVVVCNA